MRKTMLTFFTMIAVGVFANAEGGDRTEFAGAEGGLLNVTTVELASGTVDTRDPHTGAAVVYVLEGAGSWKVDGKPAVTLAPGTVVHLAPKHRHVLTNTSPTQTLKVLVVDLVETEQSRLVLTNSGMRQQKEARQDCEQLPSGDVRQKQAS